MSIPNRNISKTEMGNHMSCVWQTSITTDNENVSSIRVVDPQGISILLQEHHITAAELMLKYAQCVVCNGDSFYIGQKIPALCADNELMMGNVYFLLPKELCGSVLTASCLATLAAGTVGNSAVSMPSPRMNSASVKRVMAVEAFQMQKSDDGRMQLKVSPNFIQNLLEVGKVSTEPQSSSCCGLCSTPELQKNYQNLVKDKAQSWRPKLETILENEKGFKLFRLTRKQRT